MIPLLRSASVLLVGVLFGWWLRETTFTPAPLQQQTPATVPALTKVIPSREKLPISAGAGKFTPASPAATNTPPTATRFRQLLQQQDFDQALVYYEQALVLDDRYQHQLKPELEAYLKGCLHNCVDGIFAGLADRWLANYYEDIPVLLLLAEHQRLRGYPEEAAGTLQIAATYALQVRQQEAVNAAVAHLVKATDENLTRQQNWIELLGFYEYLHIIDLDKPEFLLRQASLYQTVGESQSSRELLLELQHNDPGINSDWTAALHRMLAINTPETRTGDQPQDAISVTRRGDHYLVEASLNGIDKVTLMIDTGASITTLSKKSFAALTSQNYVYRGSRVFNTANGRVQGRVYRAASLALGDRRINNVDIAVLDYQSSHGADGLLGMNVLRNYRFEIDQDKELLYLRPRR